MQSSLGSAVHWKRSCESQKVQPECLVRSNLKREGDKETVESLLTSFTNSLKLAGFTLDLVIKGKEMALTIQLL